MTMGIGYPPGMKSYDSHVFDGFDDDYETTAWCDGCENNTVFLVGIYAGEITANCSECGYWDAQHDETFFYSDPFAFDNDIFEDDVENDCVA